MINNKNTQKNSEKPGKDNSKKISPQQNIKKETKKISLRPEVRLALIRKGNELLNKGDINLAERIFITTKYVDGLIRLGDYYLFKKGDVLHALKLYQISGYKKRIEEVAENLAAVVKAWLKEDET